MRRAKRGAGIPVDSDRVRQARIDAGLSLAQLAGNDVSRTFLHFVEHGKSRPSRSILNLIAKRTGKPVRYFLAPSESQSEDQSDLATELARIAGAVRRFSRRRSLSQSERAAMRLLQGALEHGAQLVNSISDRSRRDLVDR